MKDKILLTIKIILSVTLLIYLLSIIPLNKIIDSILSTDLFLFTVGMLLTIPISYLSAFETQYLTRIQGINLSVFKILKIQLASSFYGLFLPGSLSGGAVKWYKFSKYGKKSDAAAVVVFNRFLEVLMVVFFGIFFSIPAFYSLENQSLVIVLVIMFFLMITIYLFLIMKAGLNFIEKTALVIPLPAFIKDIIIRFTASMRQFQNLKLKDHFEIIGLLFLYHGIGVASFFCFAKSLDINLNIWIIGWIRSAISIAIILPLSFAGLGIREGTLVFLLGQYGITPNVAMAFSFLFFFRNLLISLAGGLFEFKELIFSKNQEKVKLVKEKHSIF
jgi:uncharacterized protein (TIRG00374 family)